MTQKSELDTQQFRKDKDQTDSLSAGHVSSYRQAANKPEHFRPVLICLVGPQRGHRFKIERETTVVGRSRESDFMVNDNSSSRRNTAIIYTNWDNPREAPRCFVEDLKSRNGTELNGKLIEGRVALRERDRITIGRTVVGFFFRDEVELMQDESLYENATRDMLTGLDNRRQFIAHLKHYLAKATRRNIELAMLVVDIDHFKNVNDTYGHSVGDHALRHVARILLHGCRESDLIARWGGEEFVLALPDTSLANASRLAERLRYTLENSPLQTDDHRIKLTISIGGTMLTEADTLDTFFMRGDKNLYSAKQTGRNKVVMTT